MVRTIDAGRFETIHLLAKSKRREAGDLELRILDQDGSEYPIRFEAHDIAFDFKPPFVGERHHVCLNELANALRADLPNSLINVVGGAGRGKSRLIEEALSRTEKATRKVIRAVVDPIAQNKPWKSCSAGLRLRMAGRRVEMASYIDNPHRIQ